MFHYVYRNAKLITLLSEKYYKLSPNGNNLTRLRIFLYYKQDDIDVASHPSCCVTIKWREKENINLEMRQN
jgi:hypothetical protein